MLLGACAREFSRPPWRGLFAVSAAGLVLVVSLGSGSALPALCGGSWSGVLTTLGPVDTLTLVLATNSLPVLALEWAAMLLAMMPLLLAQPIVHVRRSSRSARRARSVLCFILGYGSIWFLAGPVLVAVSLLAGVVLTGIGAPLAFVALACVWSASPCHQMALNRGHRVKSLAVFGWTADGDALMYGLLHGLWCFAACWAWMLVPLVFGDYHATAMIAVGLVMLCERLTPPAVPVWRCPLMLRVLVAVPSLLRERLGAMLGSSA